MVATLGQFILSIVLALGNCATLNDIDTSNKEGLLPSFAWDTLSWDGTIHLRVDFNDNGPADVAQLIQNPNSYLSQEEENTENECVLSGFLRDDAKAPVTVSGCPGAESFQVIILSRRLHHTTFDVENEHVVVLGEVDKDPEPMDDSPYVHTWTNQTVKSGTIYLPRQFRLEIALRYDNYFLDIIGKGSHPKAQQRANEIVKIANTFYRDFEGLGTSIEFDIVNVRHVDEEMRLREAGVSCDRSCQIFEKARGLAGRDSIDPDHFHYLSQDPEGGTNGGAYQGALQGWRYRGSVCLPEKSKKVAITDTVTLSHWSWNQIRSNAAKTFAHELGHSLGMYHDFQGPKSCRGHIMDYGDTEILAGWSHCSKEAIAGWFEQLSDHGMNCKA